MKLFFRKLTFLCFAFVPLFSCAARIDGSFAEDSSAALTVVVSLEPRMTALIRSLAAVGGQTGPVLDGSAITQSMSGAPGVAHVSLRNTTPSAVEGQVRISRIGEFLAAADGSGFITFEQGRAGGRCVITINRENGPVILELLSAEIADYLNALMAPLATGEEISRPEYLELIAVVYNRAISDEIAGSRFRAFIEFPGVITSVTGGTFSGRRAIFDIPLLDLLVLETPLNYEVRWN
jgi:hypothetical protein